MGLRQTGGRHPRRDDAADAPRAPRRLPIAYGWLVKRPIDREAESSYLLAGMTIPGVERDLKRVIKGLDTRDTNEAADRLSEIKRPALIA